MAKASTKKCTVCEVGKEISEENKTKQAKYNKKWRDKNKEKISKAKKEYYLKNKEIKLEKSNEYYKNNKESCLERRKRYYSKNKERLLKEGKVYYQNNKEAISKTINARLKIRRVIDSKYRIKRNMSCVIWNVLRKNKLGSWQTIVSYSVKQLMDHLESKFTNGMTWENYGRNGWEIDHIIPQSLFKFDSAEHPAFKACWALENLQPLWATTKIAMSYGENTSYIGNFEKGNRIKLTKKQEKLLKSVNSEKTL